MHVYFDRCRYRIADIIIASLACQDGVKIISLKIFQEKHVDSFARFAIFIRPINESVFSPPIELRSGGTWTQYFIMKQEYFKFRNFSIKISSL